MKMLQAIGIDARLTPGTSIVNAIIDSLFPLPTLKDANQTAEALFISHTNERTSGSSTGIAENRQLSSQDARYAIAQPQFHESYGPSPRARTSLPKKSLSCRMTSVTQAFRDTSQKFTDAYDSSVSLYRFKMMFKDSLDQYSIPQSNRIQLLVNALGGMALDFYLDKTRGHPNIKTLNDAFAALDAHARFNSPHTQAQAQAYLDKISIQSIRTAEQCSTAKAF